MLPNKITKQLLTSTFFETSANSLTQLPRSRSEIAFAGRSNAGKSSALNLITGQKQLARTSKTPGRTQLINYFKVLEQVYMVDLPGYGYAKVPADIRIHWQNMLQRYFEIREALHGLIILMDIRHPLTELDRQMIHWCELRGLPTHILLTKADKLSKSQMNNSLNQVKKELEHFNLPISVQLFSATKPEIGLNEIYTVLGEWLGLYYEE